MIKFERRDIPIRQLASGTQVSVPVFSFTGDAGPTVYIQANIHGPEIAGCGAIYQLLNLLPAQGHIHGKITLVPSINPIGLDTKIMGLQVGYMDLNDPGISNWNRAYPLLVEDTPAEADAPKKKTLVNLSTFIASHKDSSETTIVEDYRVALQTALEDTWIERARHGMLFRHRQALTALRLALQHDFVLDLHTAGRALQHLYLFEPYREQAAFWRIPYIIQLPDGFTGALDEAFIIPWLKLQKAFKAHVGREIAFNRFQKECYTVELGDADTLSHAAMQEDAARIINYLRSKGIIEGQASAGEIESVWCTMEDYVRYAAPSGGLLVWEKSLGSAIAQGDTLATIIRPYAFGDDTTADTVPVTAREAGILMNHIESHVVQEGMSICAVMTNVQPLSPSPVSNIGPPHAISE